MTSNPEQDLSPNRLKTSVKSRMSCVKPFSVSIISASLNAEFNKRITLH